MLKAKIAGVVGVVSMLGMALLNSAHAAVFAVSTTTANSDNGTFLQSTYDYLISSLSSGGVVVYVVVITILAGIIALVIWGLHKLFGGRRV